MRFYSKQRLGLKRSLTPEGFLICQDVPIARTGDMVYAEGELMHEDGTAVVKAKNGIVVIERDEAELFSEITIASCVAKPVTISHPEDWVNPDNYSVLAKGTMINLRRGEGGDNDLLIADLLVTERQAIDKIVKEGVEEVSLGYDADYEEIEAGRGKQRNIIVNHIALVEMGRCGSRCAIGDKKPMSWLDKLKSALKTKDQKAIDEAMAEAEKAETKDEETEEEKAAREAAEAKTKDEAEEAEKEKATKTGDSAVLAALNALGKRLEAIEKGATAKTADALTLDDGQWSDLVSKTEIIAPGMKLDRESVKTKDGLCTCQRQVLQQAMAKDAGSVTPFLQGVELSKMTRDQLGMAFTAVAEVMRAKNNLNGARHSITTKDFGRRPPTPAEINKTAKDFWKTH